MTRADKFLVAAILFVALGGLLLTYRSIFSDRLEILPLQAIISVQGSVVQKIDLVPGAGKRSYQLTGRLGLMTIEVDGARIHAHAAPCPNQICVKQGWIEHPGESIVCVPGEVVIHIAGLTAVDAVTR